MSWLATAPPPSAAPAALVARHRGEVIIRVRLPWVICCGLATATRAGLLHNLTSAWRVWTPSGSRSRLDDGEVVHAYGYLHGREARLPVDVWRALAAAIYDGLLDRLPAVDATEIAAP
ncbi:hypothetical protein [Frankia sp. AgB32]|uniref:hypothetical protein n=1 Tax=Frankia sp. AgB32 TaxID=631119 RepID=UPI00201074F5|nr:hypothetical protein [Frankia sp. AgB32]MCK9898286.1 hypothetical protein [Frankia sp. AgB32]